MSELKIEKLKNHWEQKNNKLTLKVTRENFMECIDLVNKIATLAENQNHHPDLCIKDYKKIEIIIYTHEKNEVTSKDIQLATAIDLII